jgi:hypothetical protein
MAIVYHSPAVNRAEPGDPAGNARQWPVERHGPGSFRRETLVNLRLILKRGMVY